MISESIAIDDKEIGRALPSAPRSVARGSDDPVFIEKLKAGDAAAFEALVDRYSGDLYALLYRLTQNAEEARDLTQDTFLRVIRSIGGFRGQSELRTWLYRIAVNESRNRYRWWKRRRRDSTISLDATIGDSDTAIHETLSGPSADPEQETLAHEREYALKAALLELPEVYREAVVLCDIEGLTYDETAAALGIGLGTVKSRISRGREELRRRLQDI